MVKLIVNADDFGYSKGVNYGILEAHLNGIVNSTTMMMNMSGVDHAVEIAKCTPTLGVGIHLVLTTGRPLCSDLTTIVDDEGKFQKPSFWLNQPNVNIEEVEREWDRQIQRFLFLGLKPTHLDSHHHIHMIPIIQPIISKLSQKYKLPVRVSQNEKLEGVVPFTDILLHDFYGDHLPVDYFSRLSDRVSGDMLVEVMVHPAFVDTVLKNGSSYCEQRLKELDILTNSDLPDGFVLVEYGY